MLVRARGGVAALGVPHPHPPLGLVVGDARLLDAHAHERVCRRASGRAPSAAPRRCAFSTPFCSESTGAASGSTPRSASAAARVSCDFAVTTARSQGPGSGRADRGHGRLPAPAVGLAHDHGPAAPEGVQMRSPRHHRHVVPVARQQRAVVRADRPRADHEH